MRAVFAHDHIFREDIKGNYYTGACFNNMVWKRYLRNFDELIVLARLDRQKIPTDNKYNSFHLENLSFKAVPTLSDPLNILKNRHQARRIIYEELKKSDVLIARLPSEIGNLAIKIAKELNKPYLIEVVGCIWDSLWNYGTLQARIYAPIAYYRMKKYIKDAKYAIYVTNEFLQKRYPTSAVTRNISNVELNEVSEDALIKRMKRYSSSPKDFLTIGMIGSLNNKIKGIDVALRALSELKKEKVKFEFKVLGDGDPNIWLPLIQQLNLEENVEFCGLLPGGEPVLKWLDNIDIYIQPSYQEGLPRAVIEAMSRGCPVVGSTAGGIPELVNRKCLHKPGSYEKLAKIIKEINSDKKYMENLSKENLDTAKKYQKSVLDSKRYDFLNLIIENS